MSGFDQMWLDPLHYNAKIVLIFDDGPLLVSWRSFHSLYLNNLYGNKEGTFLSYYLYNIAWTIL